VRRLDPVSVGEGEGLPARCVVPTRRALGVEPTVALRIE
jgi:hypothetical protein